MQVCAFLKLPWWGFQVSIWLGDVVNLLQGISYGVLTSASSFELRAIEHHVSLTSFIFSNYLPSVLRTSIMFNIADHCLFSMLRIQIDWKIIAAVQLQICFSSLVTKQTVSLHTACSVITYDILASCLNLGWNSLIYKIATYYWSENLTNSIVTEQGYWVSAIAARPSSTHKGYLLGGLVWFAVPFSLATSLGLGALALDLPITASEASHGLVPPATAIALMGKAGSVLLLTMLFM